MQLVLGQTRYSAAVDPISKFQKPFDATAATWRLIPICCSIASTALMCGMPCTQPTCSASPVPRLLISRLLELEGPLSVCRRSKAASCGGS